MSMSQQLTIQDSASAPGPPPSANTSSVPWPKMKMSQQVGYLRALIRSSLHQMLVPLMNGTGMLSDEVAGIVRDLSEAHRLLGPEPGGYIPASGRRNEELPDEME